MKKSQLIKLINLSKQATYQILKKFNVDMIILNQQFMHSIIFKEYAEWRYYNNEDSGEIIEWIEGNGEVHSIDIADKVYDYENFILISYENELEYNRTYIIFDKIKQIKNLY